MLSQRHLQKIELLSDTVLYPEAVAFVRRMTQKERCNPLPMTQANGLLNIALSSGFRAVQEFVTHQRTRNWLSSKRDISIFYTQLEREFTRLQQRLGPEFALTRDEHGHHISSEDEQEMLTRLARDYIQHLLAENMLVEAEIKEQRRFQQGTRGR